MTHSGWSLFLDRDGVINELLPMDYVKHRGEFIFRSGVLEELHELSKLFKHIFIVTNQQGVGKGIMSEADLQDVHQYMIDEIDRAGGRISKIYSCIHLKELDCDCRKPKPGMLIKAFQEYKDAVPERSLLVGDSITDIEMANQFGITSVGMLHEFNSDTEWLHEPVYKINNLKELMTKVLPLVFNT